MKRDGQVWIYPIVPLNDLINRLNNRSNKSSEWFKQINRFTLFDKPLYDTVNFCNDLSNRLNVLSNVNRTLAGIEFMERFSILQIMYKIVRMTTYNMNCGMMYEIR